MLTLFAVPKAEGPLAELWPLALQTWRQFGPPAMEILLFGEASSVARWATTWDALHIPEVRRNAYGTPYLHTLFEHARNTARHEILAFINCALILGKDFFESMAHLRQWRERFLATGSVWDVALNPIPETPDPAWYSGVLSRALTGGKVMPWTGFFQVFHRDLYRNIPPILYGRLGWNDWLIWQARVQRVPIVDLSPTVTIIHPYHSDPAPGKDKRDRYEEEDRYNALHIQPMKRFYTLRDATHILMRGQVRPNLRRWLEPLRQTITGGRSAARRILQGVKQMARCP